jgi:uncharacterized membrane protein YsdA (DUF1294 family)
MAGGGSKTMMFPAWLQLMKKTKHKMLENCFDYSFYALVTCQLFVLIVLINFIS